MEIYEAINSTHTDICFTLVGSQKLKSTKNIKLLSYISHFPYVLNNANIVFGASGATNWERLVLLKPSYVVTLADNQLPIAESLSKQSLIYYAGDGNLTTAETWLKIIEMIPYKIDEYNNFISKVETKYDAYGAKRVADNIL